MDSKSEDITDELGRLPFKLLKEITNNFDPERKLGSGASGEVYKGVFKDGRVIAIKKLRFMPWTDDKQFKNEFEHLKRLKHQNIVQLVGFCDEEEDICVQFEGKMVHAVDIHRALCLEFLPKGGLGKFLSEKKLELNWHTRFKIIQGTCHGLKYLHELLTMHFDLKPDNILLDEKMMPKISDFGLSRLLGEENTVMTKTPLGTIGYLPPEFINKQVISKKYDIFSLGVIIKRIVTGMDYWDISCMDDLECIEHVHSNWRKRLQEIPAYASLEVDCKQVRTCIEIAVDCTQENPRKRPTMNEITCRLSDVENKENDSMLHDGKFYLSDQERRSSPGGSNIAQSELPSEDNRMEESVLHAVELPLEFLRDITNNFSAQLSISKRAYFTVFKGLLGSGEEIVVKRFEESCVATPYSVFRDKVSALMEIEHKNILQLVGFCYKEKRKVVKHHGRYILTDEAESYLCYEYAQTESLANYIYGESRQLDWNTRFRIIMGICEGLHFLHAELDIPIIGTRLAPEDIFLGANMEPKLADVGVSYLFPNLSSNISEYVPPKSYISDPEDEKLYEEISFQTDIYILGVLIMQIATGSKSLQNFDISNFIHQVSTLDDECLKKMYPSLSTTCFGQIKLCIQIGLWCTTISKKERPSIQEIVKKLKSSTSKLPGPFLEKKSRHRGLWLNKLFGLTAPVLRKSPPIIVDHHNITSSSTSSRSELMSSLHREFSSYQSRLTQSTGKPGVSPTVPLSVLPERLCFPLEPQRLTSCLLYLTNNTNEHIAFRLVTKNQRRYHTKLPLCSIVRPKCTYTLTVTMCEQRKQLLPNNEEFLIIQCSIAREEDLKNVDPASIVVFFENTDERKTGHEVQEIMLPVVCDSPDVTASARLIQLAEIIASQNCRTVLSVDVHSTSQNYRQVLSIDVHPKRPWILMSNYGGIVCIWNCEKKETVNAFKISVNKPVYSAKFIERRQWLVTGDADGYIHVYSYDTLEEVRKFEAHENYIMYLAVNPAFSFVLSASDDHLIKLWDWSKGWECMRTFEGHHKRVTQVMFHPKDCVNFASASLDRRVKIWNMYSGKCNITFDEQPDGLLCLHYFQDKKFNYPRQFLIAGSSDGTAKVWDPDTQTCVGMLEGHTGRLNALCWIPKHDVLVTGSLDGIVQTWKPTSTTYSTENTIGLNLGAVNAIGYIEESKRIVVGCEQGIAMVEINL